MIQCTVIIAVPLAAALAEASQIQNAHNDSSLSGVPSSPCNSLLPAGATALFVQGASPIHVNSLQAGGGVPAGLNVNLWSTNGRKPLSPVEWDMSSYTGYSAPPGSVVESISNRSGGTGAQVAGNGSTIGVLIDADTWGTRGLGAQPLPFMIEWGSGKSPPRPFVRDAENIYVSWDMRIPTATAGGCDRTGDSCAEAVLYVTMRDAISGRSLAYGLNVFDTRGSSQATVQSSVDNGAGGTGNVIVDSPVGMNTPYSVHNACSAEFQSQTWSHWKHFVFQFTRATFRAAIALGNQRLGSHYLSSNPPDYVMTDIQIDTEVEWRNGPNMRLGYSVRSFMAWFR